MLSRKKTAGAVAKIKSKVAKKVAKGAGKVARSESNE